jgi:hypothetical protein
MLTIDMEQFSWWNFVPTQRAGKGEVERSIIWTLFTHVSPSLRGSEKAKEAT